MTSTQGSITLSEWETRRPDDFAVLTGRFLDISHSTRLVLERLAQNNLLSSRRPRHGLEIKAFSHVGRIRVGDLDITILPKIEGTSLLRLIRYAYGFRRLKLVSAVSHLVDRCGFEDLLISQLNAEVHELISRGLFRTYIPTSERLSSPRGRIDLMQVASDGGMVTATLPCEHYPRPRRHDSQPSSDGGSEASWINHQLGRTSTRFTKACSTDGGAGVSDTARRNYAGPGDPANESSNHGLWSRLVDYSAAG